MRILALNYEYPPLGGGAGNASRQICRELARAGCEVAMLTSHFRGLPRREDDGGVQVYRTPVLRGRLEQCSPVEMASFIVAAAVPAVRLARTFRPDVLHVYFGIPTGPVGWLASRVTGAPYLLSLRGGDVPGFLPDELGMIHRLTAPLTALVWGGAGAIVANSPGLRDLAQQSYVKGQVQMTPNGVDTRFFTPPATRDETGPLRLLFAGRLVEQKGVTYLLNALPSVAQRLGRSVELEIVGSGPLEAALRAQAAALPASVAVRFAGWLDRDRLAERYRAADAFVLPSFEEGMPNVVLEAMASGLPVVATDIYGNRDLVTDGDNGLLVPTADSLSLADALARLGADAEARRLMGVRSRLRAEAQGWDRVAASYLEMSRTMLGAPSGAPAAAPGQWSDEAPSRSREVTP